MNDTNDDTFARLSTVLRRTFRLADDVPIHDATASVDIGGWDSLSHSILIMGVEEEFAIELPLDRAFALNNVGELAALIRSTRSNGPS